MNWGDRIGLQNTMTSSSRLLVLSVAKFQTKIARKNSPSSTPKNRVPLPIQSTIANYPLSNQGTKNCIRYAWLHLQQPGLIVKSRQVGFGPMLGWCNSAPILGGWCSLYPFIPSAIKTSFRQIESIQFVVLGLLICLKDCNSIIFDEIMWKNFWTCFLMYFRMAVLDQHPISMIEKIGTPVRYTWPSLLQIWWSELRLQSKGYQVLSRQ